MLSVLMSCNLIESRVLQNVPMKTEKTNEELHQWLSIGVDYNPGSPDYTEAVNAANLKLLATGYPPVGNVEDNPGIRLGGSLVRSYKEQKRLLSGHLPPPDQRIQDFMIEVFGEDAPRLPETTFNLDRHGLARVISLPRDGHTYKNDIIESYRIKQGVLHNPAKDRRTTKGVFHVVDYGLPIADDKKSVPVEAARNIIKAALNPPDNYAELPFSSASDQPVHCWLSLLLRPVVCPDVEGFIRQKTLETRFFAPGSMAANLDFVESIFGNGGDPNLIENDAGLDVEHWTGHSGCVILAPHLIELKKKDIGLPNIADATERQKRDGMCWESEDELYNDGGAFKLTLRDPKGRVVTCIADNYFGYCKKEVKTQISFSANLYGIAEEEHAGGAIAFPSYNLGQQFDPLKILPRLEATFSGNIEKYGDRMKLQSGGYAQDKEHSSIFYVPENACFDLREQLVTWKNSQGETESLPIQSGEIYILPSGYRVEMRKSIHSGRWRLIGTVGEGFLCHKPCTVSGGGKSEISKQLYDVILNGPVFVANLEEDLARVKEILEYDLSNRYLNPEEHNLRNRPILSSTRSMGSLIKLLTPLEDYYTEEYNNWLKSIPQHVKELLLIVKREYQPEWGDDWEKRFSVDNIDDRPGNELFLNGRKLHMNYLRVGFGQRGNRRLFSLREDFEPALKIIAEDDITASTVAPLSCLTGLGPGDFKDAAKFVHNCEYRLFQRPDDAIIRGFDHRTEEDFTKHGNFLSNYAPIPTSKVQQQVKSTLDFEQYTEPMQEFLKGAAEQEEDAFACSSANPRIVDGRPTANPRYLQTRPDLEMERNVYAAKVGTRLRRSVPDDKPVLYPVRAILPGRRNNPPDPETGIPALCCFAPIHYVELPELFMDFIASLTGKSPSTTGAGSEGAMTKAPFNMLLPIHDLNAALVSYAATGQGAFVTSAGWIGPKYKVDHDISLLIPEVWSRLRVGENAPKLLIERGYLERIEDYEENGSTVPAGRLGYRITKKFAHEYFGRIFHDPDSVFPEDMLKPELQDANIYTRSVMNIEATQKRVAQAYFKDGSADLACPPIRALLEIMASEELDDSRLRDPELRNLFKPDSILSSDWYLARVESRLSTMRDFWDGRVRYLEEFAAEGSNNETIEDLKIQDRIHFCKEARAVLDQEGTRSTLIGSLGREPNFGLPS